MELYKLENIKKTYKSYNETIHALDDVDLTIKKGEVLVILGPSGSGKSTLLNILSGIDNPTSGKVYFNNERIDNYNEQDLEKYRKNNIGFIFQTYNLVSNLTVYENVELGYHLSSNPIKIDDILDIIGLKNLKNKYPYQLSGGEMQRVAIARAISKNSDVLFCDEPTGALDEKTGKKILSLLQKINKEFNTTLIIVTHNPSISDIANTVIKMNSGKIVEVIHQDKQKDAEDLRWA